MAEQQGIFDPYYQDFELFDTSDQELDVRQLLGCQPYTTADFCSSFTGFRFDDVVSGEVLQGAKEGGMKLDGQIRGIPISMFGHAPQAASASSFDLGSESPFTLAPIDGGQDVFSSSAPQLGAYTSCQEAALEFSPLFNFSLPIVPSELPPSAWTPLSTSPPERTPSELSETSGSTFIQYTVDQKTNQMVKFDAGAGNRKGRKGKLTEEQRAHAHRMRKVRACETCRRRREKCDEGLYCRACIHYYRANLVQHPCRGKLLDSLADALLDGRLPWHPSGRTLDDFLGNGTYRRFMETITIPIDFGFGPSLDLQSHLVRPQDPTLLLHKHVTYDFPPTKAGVLSGVDETHAVLPVVLAHSSPEILKPLLENHLSLLVDEYFRDFPLYDSHLNILGWIYALYQRLEEGTNHNLLRMTLKFLVLVHIGDVLSVSQDHHLVRDFLRSLSLAYPNVCPAVATPCFVRAQLGPTISILAHDLLKKILQNLEPLSLSARCKDWVIVLSVNLVLVMAIETVQYHGARVGLHGLQQLPPPIQSSSITSTTTFNGPQQSLLGNLIREEKAQKGRKLEMCSSLENQAVDALLGFYHACYGGCHLRLSSTSPTSSSSSPYASPSTRPYHSASTNSTHSTSSTTSNPRNLRGSSIKQRTPSAGNQGP